MLYIAIFFFISIPIIKSAINTPGNYLRLLQMQSILSLDYNVLSLEYIKFAVYFSF